MTIGATAALGLLSGCIEDARIRNRVPAATTPGMTPANAFEREPASGERAVKANCVYRVFRATRGIPALAERSEDQSLGRRYDPAVKPYACYQDMLGGIHAVDFFVPIFSKPAFLKVVKKSLTTAPVSLPTMEFRATRTSSIGRANSCWCRRNASRSNRRARARITAFPSLLLVITPSREVATGPDSFLQLAIRHPCTRLSPSWRT